MVGMMELDANIRNYIAFRTGVDFNSTSDQALVIPQYITKYRITRIFVTNASTSLTTAAGGIYTAASKGGTAIVAAGQVYSSLTTSTIILDLTLAGAAATTLQTAAPLYFSLTTGQGSAATADVYVEGVPLNII
jgi:hypothetical protein